MADNPVNKSNIQGGIWPRMPKEFESYLFYKITNVDRFRLDLKDFIGNITTGLECELLLSKIKQSEEAGMPVKIPMSGINVSFTQKGLQKVCSLFLKALFILAIKKELADMRCDQIARQSRNRRRTIRKRNVQRSYLRGC